MIKEKNDLYMIFYEDLQIDDMGIYLQIQDFINCSLLFDYEIQYPVIIYNQETSSKKIYLVEKDWEEEIDYNDYNTVNQFKINKINNLNNYKLRINPLKTNTKTFNHNIEKNLNILNGFMKQNINLYTNNLQIRKQDFLQKTDIQIQSDDKYSLFEIANHIAYKKEDSSSSQFEAQNNYLPKYNNELQKIIIKLEDETLRLKPPKYLQIQVFIISNRNQVQIYRIKNKISAPSTYKYDSKYGYKYGVIYDNENNENVIVWSNKFQYDSNTFYIEWKLNNTQMELFKQNYNPERPFNLKLKYAAKTNQNNIPIWEGWSKEIYNIKINTPPESPENLRLIEVK